MSIESVVRATDYLRSAFRSCGIEPPDVVLLRSPEDGARLRSALLHYFKDSLMVDPNLATPSVVEHPDGTAWMQLKIADVTYRWPAMRWAQPGGGYTWR